MQIEQETAAPNGEAGRTADRVERFLARWALAIVVVAGLIGSAATIGAMRHQSTTFDEILMPSAGARGYATGRFDLVLDHPPIAQYLYGLPTFLSSPDYPDETNVRYQYPQRYPYAQAFYFESANDPETVAFRARLLAVAIAFALTLLVYAYTRRTFGALPAVIAGVATAFMPDVLAHGGITYNDVPMGVAFLGAVWGLDAAARRPTARTFTVAAALCTVALGVKFSSLALAPIAFVLVACEVIGRADGRKEYALRVARLLPLALVVVYLGLVAIYLGDFALRDFRWGLDFNIVHAAEGHGGVPAWLLGRSDPSGFWYFFPVAFLLKTPVALHALLGLALLGLALGVRGRTVRGLATSPLRAVVVAAVVFLAFLMRANLNIGFRHALPLLPLAAIVAGVGAAALWRHTRMAMPAVLALLVLHAGSALSSYPDFITYTSEYVGGGDAGHTALVDSSLDWGQGLLQLRDFMEEEGVEIIYLSYFGSARPEGYGIRHVPLISFFRLREQPAPATPPQFIAISATNLIGGYVNDRFAEFRQIRPYRVLGHSIFVYRVAS
jgi:hypothetical protein